MSLVATERPAYAPAGQDCDGNPPLMIWGLIPLSIKVSSADTNGDLFAFEHTDMVPGGPPRHVHHEQDEWFYVVKGEFAFEVGGQHHRLGAGDSLFAPRQVPHAWACVSETPGTLLTVLTPAGSFETFIRETTRHATVPSPADLAKALTDHGMTLLGPPLAVGDVMKR